ncbi:MAG: polysaccharide biosynthesis/export family protein [bacterium]|nr:polysaccharide biosynthesis/export family protein [bacterium]MDO5462866.1 polysaccharide biosynthesis/export family protein [bacterium]
MNVVPVQELNAVASNITPTLRVGVKVRVSVSATGLEIFPETLKEVSSEGTIVLTYIGTVKCEGMTIEEFQTELTKRYSEYYREPLVAAYYVPEEGGSSPYGEVLVTGCVARPGVVSIPQTCDLSVMHALQAVGGMGQWADATSVRVTRALKDGRKLSVSIDVEDIGQSGATDQNVILMPGDVVHVPEINW